MAFETLFSKYDRLVLFDTETTGLLYSRDEIIEFAAIVVEQRNGVPMVIQEYDQLVSLSPGGFVPPKIEELTGVVFHISASSFPFRVLFGGIPPIAPS